MQDVVSFRTENVNSYLSKSDELIKYLTSEMTYLSSYLTQMNVLSKQLHANLSQAYETLEKKKVEYKMYKDQYMENLRSNVTDQGVLRQFRELKREAKEKMKKTELMIKDLKKRMNDVVPQRKIIQHEIDATEEEINRWNEKQTKILNENKLYVEEMNKEIEHYKINVNNGTAMIKEINEGKKLLAEIEQRLLNESIEEVKKELISSKVSIERENQRKYREIERLLLEESVFNEMRKLNVIKVIESMKQKMELLSNKINAQITEVKALLDNFDGHIDEQKLNNLHQKIDALKEMLKRKREMIQTISIEIGKEIHESVQNYISLLSEDVINYNRECQHNVTVERVLSTNQTKENVCLGKINRMKDFLNLYEQRIIIDGQNLRKEMNEMLIGYKKMINQGELRTKEIRSDIETAKSSKEQVLYLNEYEKVHDIVRDLRKRVNKLQIEIRELQSMRIRKLQKKVEVMKNEIVLLKQRHSSVISWLEKQLSDVSNQTNVSIAMTEMKEKRIDDKQVVNTVDEKIAEKPAEVDKSAFKVNNSTQKASVAKHTIQNKKIEKEIAQSSPQTTKMLNGENGGK